MEKQPLPMPETWEDFYTNLVTKIATIDARLATIEARVDYLKRQDDRTTGSLINHAKRMDFTDERFELGAIEMQKLTEVYYHVFPDRLKGDVKCWVKCIS